MGDPADDEEPGPYLQGYNAAVDRDPARRVCPYPAGSVEAEWWQAGFADSTEDYIAWAGSTD